MTGASSIGAGSNFDYLTIKYNSAGQEQWVASYNGPGNALDFANAIAVDSSGNVYVTGESYGLDSARDYATIKYNSTGQEQWVARYNGPANYDDEARAIVLDGSANVYVTGYSYGVGDVGIDYATIKYNSAGQQQWVARYNGPDSLDDYAMAIAIDSAGNIYVTGGSDEVETMLLIMLRSSTTPLGSNNGFHDMTGPRMVWISLKRLPLIAQAMFM